jgi:hypothetical protein
MNLWLDAHLPPAIAPWISARFGVAAVPVRDLGLRDAGDRAIFLAARICEKPTVRKNADRGYPASASQSLRPTTSSCNLNLAPHVSKRAHDIRTMLWLLHGGQHFVERQGCEGCGVVGHAIGNNELPPVQESAT